MTKIIVLAGAPGTGKTTLSKMLHKKLKDSALVELSWLRCWHLDYSWSNASPREEQMSFENLVFILNNYIKNKFPYVITTDLLDKRVTEIPRLFDKSNYLIFSLFVNSDGELKKRVLDESRDSGYRDYQSAIEWNRNLISRNTLPGEVKIDNTEPDPEKTLNLILELLAVEQ
jgi:energy-coupling factor transporter ATP-binding protein EcfA2